MKSRAKASYIILGLNGNHCTQNNIIYFALHGRCDFVYGIVGKEADGSPDGISDQCQVAYEHPQLAF